MNRFVINIPDSYKAKLDANGNRGDKAILIRLAFKTQLMGLDNKTFARSLMALHGPFTSRVTIAPDEHWMKALQAKAEDLETVPAIVARVALCQYLDELEQGDQAHV